MTMKIHLVAIDYQNDFCIADDGRGNKGTLVVPGAHEDAIRVAKMIQRLGTKIDDISVTLDSHQTVGIERPAWWRRVSDGAEIEPFTCLDIHPDGRRIVKVEFVGGQKVYTEEEYTTRLPSYLHSGGATGKGTFGYLQALRAAGRYPHVVWTEHCIVGTWGACIVPELMEALKWWERTFMARVNLVAKGNNPLTEHFSAVKAEVPDPADPSTQLNKELVRSLEQADRVVITGEALSHCVANTARDIASAFGDPAYVRKMVLLTDTTSNVSGFEFLGQQFIADLTKLGMGLDTSEGFMA